MLDFDVVLGTLGTKKIHLLASDHERNETHVETNYTLAYPNLVQSSFSFFQSSTNSDFLNRCVILP